MKPILFNTEMVRAILDGRKTCTRRVVKPQPMCFGPNATYTPHDVDFFLSAEKHLLRCRTCGHYPEYSFEGSDTSHHWEPPYLSGDILYVRETWRAKEAGYPPYHSVIEYKAGGAEKFEEIIAIPTAKGEWKPSIHMPKEAARLFLRVTDVRVERLHEITMSGMMDEGAIPVNVKGGQWQQWQREYMRPVWDSTIKKADLPRSGWDANPWVWAIPFEQISKEEAIDNA